MAIDINNANYKLFTDFAASAAKQTTRAELGTLLTDDGEARTVKASSRWDFIGNVGRLSATKADNNAVRTLFRKTIADMFGGEDKIPASVKDAMKLEDYGHGKPLTARRITLVKTAVEQVAANAQLWYDKSIDLLKSCNIDKKPEFAALSKTVYDAIVSCGGDVDAMEAIATSVTGICISGSGELRSEEAVLTKIEAIKSNFRELREVAKGNDTAYQLGKGGIVALRGKSMPEGAFRAMAEAAKKADVSTIRRLNAQSSSATINRAILQFFKSYDDVLKKTGLLATFMQDGTMFADGRNFVWAFMLNQLSRSKQREIQAALSSENAADLYELLIQGNKNWFRDIEFEGVTVNEAVMGNPNEEVPENLKNGISENMYRVSSIGFGTLHNILGMILGEAKDVPDQAEKGVPEDYDLIIADYAKDAKARLSMEV